MIEKKEQFSRIFECKKVIILQYDNSIYMTWRTKRRVSRDINIAFHIFKNLGTFYSNGMKKPI